MALCHDERDYAMGFTRRDPHAHKRSTGEIKKREERKRYLRSLTPTQKRVTARVEFCITAVGALLASVDGDVPIFTKDLHAHFPLFAKKMGFTDRLCKRGENGKCQAVTILFPESKDGLWLFFPRIDYMKLPENEQKKFNSKRVREAALVFCKAWLPEWNWN